MTKEDQLIKAIADVVSGLRSEIEELQSENERLKSELLGNPEQLKAETEFIREKIREKYKWITYLNISEQNELEELIKSYARIQIEKRTNEIIDIITDYESPMPNEFIISMIKELPINLD